MIHQNTNLKLEIKDLRIAGGEETLRFELILYVDGKRSAIVSNEGTGGSHRWIWLDANSGETQKRFNAHIQELSDSGHFEFPFEQADQLIDKMIFETQLKADCQTGLCFQLEGQTHYFKTNRPDSPEARKQVAKKFPNQAIEFLNDRFTSRP